MKIGILYICTGKYNIFWKNFYLSCEKYFIPNAEKHYFIFTDADSVEFESDNQNIHKIYQKNLGWPDNTLKRYEVFLKAKNLYVDIDYLFFMNANLLFKKEVKAEEFLPQNTEKVVGCLHPGYFNKQSSEFTYEKRPESKAFITKEIVNRKESRYYAGGINGGVTSNFIEIMELLENNIKQDEENNITAIWHDESHWNWYLNNHLNIVKTLSPSYLYPEGKDLPFVPKIIIRDKSILGGHAKFRNKFEIRLILNSLKHLIKNTCKSMKFKTLIKLNGGLGNQLFQYAHARDLELHSEKIEFDVSFFHGNRAAVDTARNFKLNNFNIRTRAKFSPKKHSIIDVLDKVKRKIGINVEVFYQNEKYFSKSTDVIREELTLKNPLSTKTLEWQKAILTSNNSTSLHVRRGDYVSDSKTNSYHGTCDVEYYKKALETLVGKIGNKNIEIFVFSDDITWAKDNLTFPYSTRFVSDPNIPDYEEMYLMSLCKHNIIANSTFSWWGAWLNKNPNKIVIGPKQWFRNKASEELDILPKEWITI